MIGDSVEPHVMSLSGRRGFLSDGEGRRQASLFITTLNCGGIKDVGVEGVGGDLREWIPLGYDLYCVGLQECLILKDLRCALHEVLGGPTAYTMFYSAIGDSTVLHGEIALVIFAKTR